MPKFLVEIDCPEGVTTEKMVRLITDAIVEKLDDETDADIGTEIMVTYIPHKSGE